MKNYIRVFRDFMDGSGGGSWPSVIEKLPSKYDIRSLENDAEEYLISAEKLNTNLRKSLFWSLRLMRAAESLNSLKKLEEFYILSFGVFQRPNMTIREFGIIINFFNDAEINLTLREFPSSIIIDQNEFPLFFRRIDRKLHEFKSNPPGGTGGCYARRNSVTDSQGILTAKHVVGNQIGSKLKLSCGCAGEVICVGPDGIDSAIVSSNCYTHTFSSPKTKLIEPMKLIPPWLGVKFWGSTSGWVNTTITSVTDTRGIYNTSILPSRIFLNKSGQRGDSGALIKSLSDDIPLGIYMGEAINPSGGAEGLAQNLYQASIIMDFSIYI
jgi:hypothetical protein